MSVLEKFEDGTRQRASDNTATNSEASMTQKRREFIIHDTFVLNTLNKNYPWFLCPYFVFFYGTNTIWSSDQSWGQFVTIQGEGGSIEQKG